MARNVALPVHAEKLQLDEGLWCQDCNLTTGIRVWIYVVIGRLASLRSEQICTECGRRNLVA